MKLSKLSTHKRFTTFFLAIAMVSVIGCASTSTQEGTGEYVDDTVITSKVKAAILGESSLKSAEINVETFKGIVQLSGFVSSNANKGKAVELARSVKGVKSVKDDMRLREGSGQYVDDTVITSKVKAAILGESSLKSTEINVETFKGVVQLSGFVSSGANKSKAVELARSVKGVKSVKDDMRLK
jgi:hyperosmotically inducible protein